MIQLDERLSALADLIEACDSVADIGTDHGLLGAYLLQRDVCRKVQFLDISSSSLEKAKRLIQRLGLEDRAVFNVGDGAAAMKEPADNVVIAGMGCNTIIEILQRGQDKLGGAKLVLQPNLGVEKLRETLVSLGYLIEDERIAFAAGRHYVALRAARGRSVYTQRELLAGPVLLRRGGRQLIGYAEFRLKVLSVAYRGAKDSEPQKAVAMLNEINEWKEILAHACDQ
ncbi:MAG: SAM-dependent methyltransferase [Clostridia bacterium]|nr:SAM-dependent methyltransferase [Clostridia bacterium]